MEHTPVLSLGISRRGQYGCGFILDEAFARICCFAFDHASDQRNLRKRFA
jgi:hypothetical protein